MKPGGEQASKEDQYAGGGKLVPPAHGEKKCCLDLGCALLFIVYWVGMARVLESCRDEYAP